MKKQLFGALVLGLLFVPLLAACGAETQAAQKPAEIRLDYAYYNPSSLVLKKFGWLEENLKADGIPVKWLYSAGSNKAAELLRSQQVHLRPTAGARGPR